MLLLGQAATAQTPAPGAPRLAYPAGCQDDTVDTCFGNRVPDPYRWLEHNRATDTKDWVQAENQLTERYFSQILFRGALRQCLTSILNYERYSVPHQEGQNTYFSKNTGL